MSPLGRKAKPVKTSLKSSANPVQPYITAEKSLPEITLKATLLSIFLAVIMAGSNAYLGLKIGLTVSATIPAAVISMTVLRFFRNSNILENNIVQTATSAGEVIAAAVVFTLPALLMMGYWKEFPFGLTTAIIIVGGLLGVLFSIPLRRAYIVENEELKFPEGIATGEVLKVGDSEAREGTRDLLMGGMFAGLIKFAQSGLMVMSEGAHYWFQTTRTVFGFGSGFSLVLVGAGYIVGVQVGVSMLIGAIVAWVIAVPLHGFLFGLPEGGSAYEIAVTIWNKNIRMIGVGTMVVGGVWTLVYLIKPIAEAIRSSLATLRKTRLGTQGSLLRTEYDIPINYVLIGVAVLTIPLAFIFHVILSQADMQIPMVLHIATVSVVTLFAIIVGFLCAAIAGYMTGLVGSSNNPLSGVTIMAILFISMILLVMLGTHIDFGTKGANSLAAAAIAIIIGAVMATAAAISGDNLQDLKSGQIVGATPWKQQVMLMLGVVAGSFVMAPILEVLYQAYGIGDSLPREGMDPTQALGAPKAAIMAAIAEGVFTHSLDWTMFSIGAALAIIFIIVDHLLKDSDSTWRLPVLAVALGIYMPLDITIPLLVGGIIASLCQSKMKKEQPKLTEKEYTHEKEYANRRGMLFCSGLIAGESIIGILLAIPFAAYQSTDVFKIAPADFEDMGVLLGMLAFVGVAYYLYKIASQFQKSAKK